MKVAYADPPYMGCAYRYPEKREVDYIELMERLCCDYDAWALSCSSPSLKRMLILCPDDVRIGVWVKPFCSFKPNVNPAYAWEPVIFYRGRKLSRSVPTVTDWVSANITLKKGLVGAKPEKFCYWIFAVLGLNSTDELCDLYPGTGVVGRCWEKYKNQARLL